MNNINFKEKEKYISSYGLGRRGEYTPIIMIKDCQEYFIGNIVKDLKFDSWAKLDYNRRLEEIDIIKEQLINNNGNYYREYGRFKNPFDFIQWIQDNNYTFEIHGELFRENKNFTDFHGNLKEYSSAFMYRIYDPEIKRQLMEAIKNINQHYNYKNN